MRVLEALARPSLVRRLVLLAAGWSLATLVVASLGLGAFFRQAAIARLDTGLSELIDNLYAGSSVDYSGTVTAPPLTDAKALRVYSGRYWQIAEPDGRGGLRVLTPSRSLFDAELKVDGDTLKKMTAERGKAVYFDTMGPLDQPLRGAALESMLPGRSKPVVFMAAEDRSPVERDTRRFAVTASITVALLGVGLMVAVLVQVQVGLAPLFALRREVAEVRKGKAERLARRYPVELAPLADELNGLLTHNQEVVERQRTHVGNLAHALKTPLSVMLAEAQAQPGPLADVVSRQAEAMRGHVDHHLRRARAAARSQTSGERTEVAPVLDDLAVALERIFQDKGLEIDWRCPDDLCFLGEKQDFLELAGNVIENAGKWSTRRVKVTAEPVASNRFTLTVDDDGPGLPAERRDEVLKRGTRLDENAPGSGLGLSIVDELARAYGGEVKLDNAPIGGLRVVLTLPMAET
ncbi:ATP-binding protein [Caulobacter sp. NIBR2454]|uniref:ATP-binding protein n=1 Tax=Caulobacter sp. NIBR2454 TaxID=3015996 RepID=UPI0022B722F1|nr:ATP-binding protein [Caulobacter sp. NIBR2454]